MSLAPSLCPRRSDGGQHRLWQWDSIIPIGIMEIIDDKGTRLAPYELFRLDGNGRVVSKLSGQYSRIDEAQLAAFLVLIDDCVFHMHQSKPPVEADCEEGLLMRQAAAFAIKQIDYASNMPRPTGDVYAGLMSKQSAEVLQETAHKQAARITTALKKTL
jgi:hypothetical protein